MKEQRKHERIPASIVLELYAPGSKISKGKGCAINLSRGGMALDTEEQFDFDTNLSLPVNLPIQILGKIVWKQERGKLKRYGIRFTKIDFLDKLKLKRHIKRHVEEHLKKKLKKSTGHNT